MKMPSWINGMERAIRAKEDVIPEGYITARQYAEAKGISQKHAYRRLNRGIKAGLVVAISLMAECRGDGKTTLCRFYGPPIKKKK